MCLQFGVFLYLLQLKNKSTEMSYFLKHHSAFCAALCLAIKRQILCLVFCPRTILNCFALELSVFKTKQLRIVLGRILGQKNQIQNPSLKLEYNQHFKRSYHIRIRRQKYSGQGKELQFLSKFGLDVITLPIYFSNNTFLAFMYYSYHYHSRRWSKKLRRTH